MNENSGCLVLLWSGADSRSTLGADSLWFSRLVLTPSKVQVLTPSKAYMLTPRSYSIILLLFQFCSVCPVSILVSEQTLICLKHPRSQSKTKKITQKKKKKYSHRCHVFHHQKVIFVIFLVSTRKLSYNYFTEQKTRYSSQP